MDEIWSFVYAKQAHVERAKKAPPEAGDAWTWTAIDADTKLLISWFLGYPFNRSQKRNGATVRPAKGCCGA